MGVMSYSDVKQQSLAVFGQFGESKWIPYAHENAKLPRLPADSLKGIGLGKTLVLAAMGESVEDHIDTIRDNRDKFDLVVNDKAFGFFVERGIKPDYVMLCDCNIPIKWLEKHVEATEGVTLVCSPYANPEWTKIWRGPRYFFLNMDAIQSERKFIPMFPDARMIPAASNVSNGMVSFFIGAKGSGPENWAGYERYLLVGYDYSWRPHESVKAWNPDIKTGKYYAFEDVSPKRFYMNHRTVLDVNGDLVNTSENLFFSVRWLFSYVTQLRLPVINCSGRGILRLPAMGDFKKEIGKLSTDPFKLGRVKVAYENLKEASKTLTAAREMFEKAREELYHGCRL